MTLGQTIYNYRMAHGYSMESFGKLCGCSKQYIAFLEKGSHPTSGRPIRVSATKLAAIAKAMNMDIDDLIDVLDPDTQVSLRPEPLKLTYKERDLIDRYRSLNQRDRDIIDNLLSSMTTKKEAPDTEAQ